jgi:hypothetical protein
MNSDGLVKSIKRFLKELNLLNLEAGDWNTFDITHLTREPTSAHLKNVRERLKMLFPNDCGGIYVYESKQGVILYVGKAKSLYTRVYSHYREAYTDKGDKTGVWHFFFNKNAGDLKVYWVEIEYERERHIVEQCLELILNTSFDREFPPGKRVLPDKT